jgi:hypothetical protein
MPTTESDYGSGPDAIRAVVDAMKVEMDRGGALPVFGLHVWINILEPYAAPEKATTNPAGSPKITDTTPKRGLRVVREEGGSDGG